MNKEKLLYIVEAMGGGVFTYIVDLANELVNTYDMYIAYAARPQTPADYRDYFDRRIHLIEVKNFTRSVSSTKDIKAFFKIKKNAKDIQTNIIHLHSSKAGVLGRWALNGRKTPIFYTSHGYSFLMSNYGWVKRTVYKLIETISAKRYCMTISCSEGEHQETLKLTKRATYVDNGINTEQLQELMGSVRVDCDKERSFTVFTLGRICCQKNPALFNQIAEAMPDVHFLWIGEGELRNQLTAPNIEISGWLDRKYALQKSMAADVFMLTSLWEGLPLSLLEAMYMKKPCVVNNVIGNRDVIRTGINGFVCDSVDEFVAAVSQIKAGHNEMLIKQAYSDIMEKFNTSVMAEKYNSICSASEISGGGTALLVVFVPKKQILFIRYENLNDSRFCTDTTTYRKAVA